MSANNIEIVVAETVTKVAKTKTPTLSGKYIKFLVFGNWFIDRLAVAGTADEATIETMREQLQLFDGVSKQTEMFDLFFLEIKDSTKSMKALIRKHNAPPKKEKKSRAKASVATDGTETEKKRGRKKKATEVVHDKQDDLVAEIVAAAQGTDEPSLVVEQVAEPVKKKYVRKPKIVEPETARALEPELVAEQIVEPVAVAEVVAETETKKKVKAVKKTDEEKLAEKALKDAEKLAEKEKKDAEKLAEKAKKDAEKLAEKEKKDAEKLAEKAKKDAEKLTAKADKADKADKKKKTPPASPTTPTTPANDDENDDDDDVELDVRKITCASSGLSYLLDNDNNVYDINSHSIVGKFNNLNNSVIII
jgi:septal ring factor EnvC (AmiA/AmiB activator)